MRLHLLHHRTLPLSLSTLSTGYGHHQGLQTLPTLAWGMKSLLAENHRPVQRKKQPCDKSAAVRSQLCEHHITMRPRALWASVHSQHPWTCMDWMCIPHRKGSLSRRLHFRTSLDLDLSSLHWQSATRSQFSFTFHNHLSGTSDVYWPVWFLAPHPGLESRKLLSWKGSASPLLWFWESLRLGGPFTVFLQSV